ncbi:MAG: histidinol-phosphatase HisJ family protein [Firmicutes bacterium]|nr:histidinol-phosphatase HisJ family protein [Bacillota bacterium]
MLFDTHVHSRMSADSETPPEEAVRAAERLGLGLIFAEHVDYELPGYGEKYVADVPLYLSEYAPLKSPRVLTGLEIGLTPSSTGKNAALASDKRLDFVIGSLHVTYGYDNSAPEFWNSPEFPDPKAAYLESAAEMAEACDFFDSLGHIDYPSRYCPLPEREIRYRDYIELYDRIFGALIKSGRVLEINTGRLVGRHASADAEATAGEVCAAYANRGGKYVTIGSDAHTAGAVGAGFGAALRIAKSAGLQPVFFRGRRMYKSIGPGENSL